MGKLYVISEGRTESDFVKNVLAEHLCRFGWDTYAVTLINGKNKVGVRKGGFHRKNGYAHAIKEIVNVINTDTEGIYTTLFDFYGFTKDIPCYENAQRLISPYDKVELYENQIKQDVYNIIKQYFNGSHFIPYVQPYEFETLLFTDEAATAEILSNGDAVLAEKLKADIKKIMVQFENPEYINNGFDTAP